VKQKQTIKDFCIVFFALFFIFAPSYTFAAAFSVTHATQAQWQAGSGDANIDLTTSPNDILLDVGTPAFSATQDSYDDFRAGTFTTSNSSADWETNPGKIQINPTANAQWTANGKIIDDVEIETDGTQPIGQTIAADVSGGATTGSSIITWKTAGGAIKAQKIDSSGDPQWGSGGVIVCSTNSEIPQIISDGNGGAIITWVDYRDVTKDIYAQRLADDGDLMWPVALPADCGVPVSTAANAQEHVRMISDGAAAPNGAIITWDDYRSGTDDDVYAQRINSAGVV